MNKIYNGIAILAFAIILTGFVIVPVALPIALFTVATGIAVAPWVASAIAFPLSVYIARKALSL